MLGRSRIKVLPSNVEKKASLRKYYKVYGKKGENYPKVKCKGKIKKIVVSNRASFFCNKCQK